MAKILLTGATGYIGRALLPVLTGAGHEVVCLVRDPRKLELDALDEARRQRVTTVEGDLLRRETLDAIPKDVRAAYYLVHSMADSYREFEAMERAAAQNFADAIRQTSAEQIIYLGGIANAPELSHHLRSRLETESILRGSGVPLTVLRAAIIIGAGGASFQIITDLVERLPVMVAPRWLETRCQPIALSDVLDYLSGVLLLEPTYGEVFDVGGPEILTYGEMLEGYAAARHLRRKIVPVPVLTPRLSSLWLQLVTSASYPLARSLVDSMKSEVVVERRGIDEWVHVRPHGHREALDAALSAQTRAGSPPRPRP